VSYGTWHLPSSELITHSALLIGGGCGQVQFLSAILEMMSRPTRVCMTAGETAFGPVAECRRTPQA